VGTAIGFDAEINGEDAAIAKAAIGMIARLIEAGWLTNCNATEKPSPPK
jgi:hypothetical protein